MFFLKRFGGNLMRRENKKLLAVALLGMLIFGGLVFPGRAWAINAAFTNTDFIDVYTDGNGLMHTKYDCRVVIDKVNGTLKAGAGCHSDQCIISVINGTFISDAGETMIIKNGSVVKKYQTPVPPKKKYPLVQLVIDGQVINPEVPAQLVNNRVMVPVRAVAETMGLSVDYNQRDKVVYLTKGDTRIQLEVDKHSVIISNSKALWLDQTPMVIDDRVMVPVRVVSETFGAQVAWDDKSKTVSITTAK